ncbi:MAG: CPBP family intramembrane metalloprotease [Acidobacteriales bacterium]|nr:CPBP family intramembrane metalloprotease [Terriglobales bacterium]
MRKHPLILFLVLVYPLSWYGWVLNLAGVSERGGLNPLGPLVAALIVTALIERWAGVKRLLASIVRWRVSIGWYAVAFLLPIAIASLAAGIVWLLGAARPSPTQVAAWREIPDRFIFVFLFIGLGEEPGWRGFLLPRLQGRWTPLKASALLWVAWAIWHAPLFGTEFTPARIPPWMLGLLCGTIVHTWLYNRTRGSVLLQMIFHSSLNAFSAGYISPMFAGADQVRLYWIFAALWFTAAAIVVAIEGVELGRKPQDANQLAAGGAH